jgi:eukaryotic-like serine/threonine-protein kinase
MIGKTLGHYRVRQQLGRGGMGEVYAAEDLNLNRKVALKFLPEAFAGDPERMTRFEREAKLLASLNHPNIAAIYGLEQAEGKRFLVLELVEGETLAQRISKGALPVDESLGICRQIAEGLEAAHEKGVIHRDLKPANVMITDADKVKILDFGLAKALSDETQSVDSSHSPTLTEAMTRPGVILGTAAYMSPEQAKGKAVDKRADIWAFGCILYECLTGKRVFEGETVTETLATLLKGEPDWSALPTDTPAHIRRLLIHCLRKDPQKRLPHIGVARFEMDETDTSAISKPVTPKARAWRELTAWTAAALLAVVAIFLGWRSVRPTGLDSVLTPPVRLQLPLPNQDYGLKVFELSPDGRSLAYLQRSASLTQLVILNLETLAVSKVSGAEHASIPFWSPDSREIGFRSLDGKLKTVVVSGGDPRALQLGDLATTGGGASWAPDGTIVFASNDGIFKTDRSGGNSRQVTRVDRSRKERLHLWPRFLPDGRRFLYSVLSSDGDSSSVYVASLDGGAPRLVVEGAAAICLAGHVLYVRDRRLLVQACDETSLHLTGEPVVIADGIALSESLGPAFSAASSGLVVFSVSGVRQQVRLVEYDRNGHRLRVIGEPGRYANPALSPDQTRLLVIRQEGSGIQVRDNVFVFYLDKGTMSRFTFGDGEGDPAWSPDGRQIAYSSIREGHHGISVMDAIPGGKEKRLLESDVPMYPNDWSPDGRFLIYSRIDPKTNRDLWILSLSEGKSSLFVETPGVDDFAVFSPDGRWIAYASTESGQSEVYIKPRDGSGGKWPVSPGGGRQPRWRGDGKELFFASAEGTALFSVSITSGSSMQIDAPRKLFDVSLPEITRSQWVVTKDGQRFIVETREGENADSLNAVTNWRALVR